MHIAWNCTFCHGPTTPTSALSLGHIDGDARAETAFGPILGTGTTYSTTTAVCANTYCHGGGRFGNDVTTIWNQVGTGQAACGTCHGLPPAADTGHPNVPASLKCNTCHVNVVSADPAIIAPALHMNGQTDF